MRVLIGMVAALAILSAAGGGGDPASPAAPDRSAPEKAAPASKTVDAAVVQAKAKDDPNQLVCRSEIPVGSRLPVKKCMTKGEADMRRFEDRQDLERSQGDTYRR